MNPLHRRCRRDWDELNRVALGYRDWIADLEAEVTVLRQRKQTAETSTARAWEEVARLKTALSQAAADREEMAARLLKIGSPARVLRLEDENQRLRDQLLAAEAGVHAVRDPFGWRLQTDGKDGDDAA